MDRGSQVVGESFAFLDSIERASRAAALNRPVLVIGERGTGKELVAERLHRLSPRWAAPLIVMNCAALAETLIEAELFGHEAGAFTGATRTREGRFEEADGGTLFLDELATLSAGAQERLLRAVEYGEVTRIGSNKPLRVDVRIVAATNENLPSLVDKGRFRADLLDRLAFEVVTLPPLRARTGDVPVLTDHFGRRMASELEWRQWPGFSPGVMEVLERYDWPGNVRELRNTVERAVYRWQDEERPIDAVDFDPFLSPWMPKTSITASSPILGEPRGTVETVAARQSTAQVRDLRAAVSAYERDIIDQALQRCRYNQRAAAKTLGLSYDQIRHAMKRLGLFEHDVSEKPARAMRPKVETNVEHLNPR